MLRLAVHPGARLQDEFRVRINPARATVSCAPGGITLGREQGKPGTDFTFLGISWLCGRSRAQENSWPHSSFSPSLTTGRSHTFLSCVEISCASSNTRSSTCSHHPSPTSSGGCGGSVLRETLQPRHVPLPKFRVASNTPTPAPLAKSLVIAPTSTAAHAFASLQPTRRF